MRIRCWLAQDNNSYLISFSILITCLLNSAWILKQTKVRENRQERCTQILKIDRTPRVTQTKLCISLKGVCHVSLFFTDKVCGKSVKMWCLSQNQSKMAITKHCCWGKWKTDSRYRESLPKSLKEVEESGKKVFIPFPKPSQDIEKCTRWLVTCSRQFFTEAKEQN